MLRRIHRNNKGFTLVEAVVVICIIAAMAGFSYSGFTARQKKEQLRSAAMLVVEYLREAKMTAAEKSTPVLVTAGNTSYTTFIDQNNDYSYTAGTDTLIHQVVLDTQYPGVSFSSVPVSLNPLVTLQFSSRGIPSFVPVPSTGTFPANFVLTETYRGNVYTSTVSVSSVGMIDVLPCAANATYCLDLSYK